MSEPNKGNLKNRTEEFGAVEGDGGIIRCDACPVLCRIKPGKSGACDRYANDQGRLVRCDNLLLTQRAAAAGSTGPGGEEATSSSPMSRSTSSA